MSFNSFIIKKSIRSTSVSVGVQVGVRVIGLGFYGETYHISLTMSPVKH